MAVYLAGKSGDGIQYTVTGSNDSLVLPDVLISSTNNAAVALTGSDQGLGVYGTVAGNDGVRMGALDTETNTQSLTVGLSGKVIGEFNAVNATGSGKRVVNAGEISSFYSSAINANGTGAGKFTVINTGLISGSQNGLYVNYLAVNLTNYGTIQGLGNALYLNNIVDDKIINHGVMNGTVYLYAGNNKLTNYNDINGDIFTSSGNDVVLNIGGTIDGQIDLSSGDNVVKNFGDIVANIFFSIGSDLLVNRNGTIYGNISMNGGPSAGLTDTVVNRSLIDGNITFGGGIDKLDNRGGTIDGVITMGDGNDTFDNRGGSILGTVDMGIGDDRYILGLGPQVVDGGTGVDTLDLSRAAGPVTFLLGTADGQIGLPDDTVFSNFENVIGSLAGSNTISGNAANNILTGGRAADLMNGGSGNDTLNGGAGNDVLSGSTGDDTISGGIGNDTITGGAGRDTMDGGTGADTFVFASGDTSSAIFDEIGGFSSVEKDVINLLAVDANANAAGDQAFTFIGTSAFSNVAGQLRVHSGLSSGLGVATIIDGDTNGDGVADFTIALLGTLTLAATDFVL